MGVGRIVAVGVAVGVTVGVCVGVGVGVPCSAMTGAWTATEIGEPFLKKPMIAVLGCGGWSASNRKLYNVPQRTALAFGFCTKVSVLQVPLAPAS